MFFVCFFYLQINVFNVYGVCVSQKRLLSKLVKNSFIFDDFNNSFTHYGVRTELSANSCRIFHCTFYIFHTLTFEM